MSEPDLTMLALGTDLTGLGLNLNSPDPLYKVRGVWGRVSYTAAGFPGNGGLTGGWLGERSEVHNFLNP
jgi:hypothetical protein